MYGMTYPCFVEADRQERCQKRKAQRSVDELELNPSSAKRSKPEKAMGKSGEKKLTKYQEDYERYLAKQMMQRLDSVLQRNAHAKCFDIGSVLDVMQKPPSIRPPQCQQQQPQSQLLAESQQKHATIPFISASKKDKKQWKLTPVDASDPPTCRRKFMDRLELKKRDQQARKELLGKTINLCEQSDQMEWFESWIGWKW